MRLNLEVSNYYGRTWLVTWRNKDGKVFEEEFRSEEAAQRWVAQMEVWAEMWAIWNSERRPMDYDD